jgi:hypothetical protein
MTDDSAPEIAPTVVGHLVLGGTVLVVYTAADQIEISIWPDDDGGGFDVEPIILGLTPEQAGQFAAFAAAARDNAAGWRPPRPALRLVKDEEP